jgi:phosphoserine phosphatase RsbU/P
MTMQPSSDIAAKRSVLVIDSSADVRLLLSGLLTRAGYRPLLSNTGEAGLAILDCEVPSLICIDATLPGLTGPDLVRRLRGRDALRRVPIILLGPTATEAYVDEAFSAGADDYVVKPFDLRILLTRIESTIRVARDQAHAARSKMLAMRRDQLLADFAKASRVQRTPSILLPQCFKEGTIMGATLPCGYLGGDLITVVGGPGSATTAALIDVAGHDAGAAFVASSVLVELGDLAKTQPIAAALTALNRRMTASASELFACVGAIQITGTHATLLNAGLPPITIVRDGRIALTVQAGGIPPGIFADSTYEAVELELEPDDRLVIVSDGLTDPLGDAVDVGRCLAALDLLVPHGMRTSEEFMREFRTLFGGRPLVDDATLIVIDVWQDATAVQARP